MTSTTVQSTAAALPATAASPTSAPAGAVSGGGLTPLAGQGFQPLSTTPTPVGADAGATGSAPQSGTPSASAGNSGSGDAAAGAAGTTGSADGSSGSSDGSKPIDAKQGLQALASTFKDDYSAPVVAANGNVYMQSKTPVVTDGKVALKYELVAHIDTSTGKMLVSPDFLAKAKDKPDPNRKLVKQGDSYYWQTSVQNEDGTISAKLSPASQDDLQAAAADQQQQEQQQALQTWDTDKVQWIQKLSFLGGWMKTVGYTGSLVDGLSRGPNPYTGQVGSSWLNGYMILQMLDGQSGGKLLPGWMKEGAIGTALSWGTQALFMMDMGHDLQTLSQALPRTASVMRAFTAPTRSVLHGVASLVQGAAKATAPAASVAQAASGAAGVVGGAQRMGLAGDLMSATQKAAGAAGAAAGATDEVTAAIGGLGKAINAGQVQIVGAGALEGQAALLTKEGALQLVPKSMLQQGVKMSMEPAQGLAKVSEAVNSKMNGAVAALRPALRILQVGGSAFGAIAGAISLQRTIKEQGAKSIVQTPEGIGQLAGFLSSASFLGMMLLPSVGLAAGTAAVAMSALNVGSNIFAGVSMLDYAGLFGSSTQKSGGWLDHDAVRAAFLIPPLTPIGMFAMWMKKKQKAAAEKAAQLEETKTKAVSTIQSARSTSDQQLQQSGTISGAKQQPDGSIVVSTGVSNDLSQTSGHGASGAAAQQTQSSGIVAKALHMATSLLHS